MCSTRTARSEETRARSAGEEGTLGAAVLTVSVCGSRSARASPVWRVCAVFLVCMGSGGGWMVG